MEYRVTLHGQSFLVALEEDGDRWIVEVDGERLSADIASTGDAPVKSLIIDGNSWDLTTLETGQKGVWRIRLGAGDTTTAEVVTELEHSIRSRLPKSETTGGPMAIISEMPGKVLEVPVREGDRVSTGQLLAVVEAMKMENELTSPCAGRVVSVDVSGGDVVAGGTPLLHLEADS